MARKVRTVVASAALIATGIAGVAGLVAWTRRSPMLSAWAIRFLFDRGGRDRQKVLRNYVPQDGFESFDNVHYQPSEPKATMDISVPHIADDTPASSGGSPLSYPLVVWVHGGAWLAGVKEDNTDYLRLLASAGFVTASVDYPLAPEAPYPRATTSVIAAVNYLVEHAEEYRIDPTRIFLAGDSAGAQLAAQVALVISDPSYAQQTGFEPPISRDHLIGQVLYCGAFDFSTTDVSPSLEKFFKTVLWSYSGLKDFEQHDAFVYGNIAAHITDTLPPTFVNAGNEDFLLAQSRALVAALEREDVPTQSLFYPDDHVPGLAHEFQFDLRLPDAWEVYAQMVQFLKKYSGE